MAKKTGSGKTKGAAETHRRSERIRPHAGSPRDRAAFLLQALDSELREELMQRFGHSGGPEESLLCSYRRIALRYDAGNALELIESLEDAAAAYLVILEPEQAADAFAALEDSAQASLLGQILTLTPERFLTGLGRMAARLSRQAAALDPVQSAAAMLNHLPREVERRCLTELENSGCESVDALRNVLFVFEDLMLVNDKGVQAILKEVQSDQLALALKTASEKLKEKIFRNMSERAARLIQEDMDHMGPVRVSDVEAVQQQIVQIALRVESEGNAILAGRPDAEEIIS